MPDTKLFRDLEEETGRLLSKHMQVVRFPPGKLIFSEGDPGDCLYVVIDGRVNLSVNVGKTDRRTLFTLEPGDIFGEMAALDNQPRSATAEAEIDTKLGLISSHDLLHVLQHTPGTAVWLLHLVFERQRRFTARYVDEVLQAEKFKLMGSLIRSIVHDFKTPLSSISLAAEMAAKDTMSAQQRHSMCAQISRQVQRLDGMTAELLEFSRPSQVPQGLEPLDYCAFVTALLAELTRELAAKGIRLVEDPPPSPLSGPVLINAKRLSQVFYNLLDNAADALAEGGTITVRWREQNNVLITEVEDSGSGIPTEIIDSLFDPFFTHNKPKGTGLGLSICQRIVEDHGGTIEAELASGGGALFHFSLHFHKPSQGS